jgi:hypothetical protein
MKFRKFNLEKEARKIVRGRATKVEEALLLCLLADEYLRERGKEPRRGDSLDFLEGLYNLDDPRG